MIALSSRSNAYSTSEFEIRAKSFLIYDCRVLTCFSLSKERLSPLSMQTSQDDESPWVDDNDAPLHHAETEWASLSTNFTTVREKPNK